MKSGVALPAESGNKPQPASQTGLRTGLKTGSQKRESAKARGTVAKRTYERLGQGDALMNGANPFDETPEAVLKRMASGVTWRGSA